MYPGHEDKMPERNTERKIHIRMDLKKLLRIRRAELDTTLQDCAVELLDRELSESAPRLSAKSHASPGRR
jgi:hypothetical protein